MKVVIDTCIAMRTNRRLLQGPEMTALLSDAEIRIVLPTVVRDELINKYREDWQKHVRTLRDAERWLSGNIVAEELRVDLPLTEDAAVERYATMLDARLKEIGAECPDHRDLGHEQLLRKALSSKRPFKRQGGASKDGGYRDALLWETIIQRVAGNDHKTVFVTDNIRDFADAAGEALHPDLLEDLTNNGLERSSVSFCRSFEELIKRHIQPERDARVLRLVERLADEGTLFQLPGNESAEPEEMQAKIVERITEKNLMDDEEVSRLLKMTVSGVRLVDVDPNLYVPDASEVRRLDENLLLISQTYQGRVEIEFFVDHTEFRPLLEHVRDRTVTVEDASWADSVALANAAFETRVTLIDVLDQRDLKIREWDVQQVELVSLLEQ